MMISLFWRKFFLAVLLIFGIIYFGNEYYGNRFVPKNETEAIMGPAASTNTITADEELKAPPLDQSQSNGIHNADAIVDDLISMKTIKTENDCDIQIQKKNFGPIIENQAIIHCIDSIRAKKISDQQLSPRQSYHICGNDYFVQKIDNQNGIDLVERFAELTTPSIQKKSCDDFNLLFKGKAIGLDLKDKGWGSFLTMYDIADSRYVEQITVPVVSVSYDWGVNEMYYFPSTLENGNANYLGKIK